MTIHVSPEACPALVLNADFRPLSYYPLSLWSWQDAIKAVCLVHGDADTVVDPERSADADIALRLAGVAVDYHVSPGTAHGISPDGLEFASAFISRVAKK